MTKLLRWTLIVIVALMIAVAFIANANRRNSAPSVMPDPNGYDALVEAAADLHNSDTVYADLDRENLEKWVKSRAETIRLARTALTRECRVRTTNSMAFIQQHLEQVGSLKRLAHLLMAEARLAELDGRFVDAARSYLDVIRLGQAITRGGLIIDGMVGIACEAIGEKGLSTITGKLSAVEIREAVAALETIDERAEPAQATLQNERHWSRQSAPLRSTLLRIVQPGLFKATETKFTQKRQQIDLQRRRLMLGLASQRYRLKLADPKSYADIAPSYLKAIPKDPATQQPLLFP